MTPPKDQTETPHGIVWCDTCDLVFRVHPPIEDRAMRDACPSCGGPAGGWITDIKLPPETATADSTPQADGEPAPADPPLDVPGVSNDSPAATTAESPPGPAASEKAPDPSGARERGEGPESEAAGTDRPEDGAPAGAFPPGKSEQAASDG